MVASAEELVFAFTMLPLVLMVGLGLFRVDWAAVATPPAADDVDWRLFIQIMFWTSTYWQKVRAKGWGGVVLCHDGSEGAGEIRAQAPCPKVNIKREREE